MDFNMGPALEDSKPQSSSLSMLACYICQKPLMQESSYKRHISYCQRAQDRPRIRNKACQTCSTAKIKCSFQTPCRRCAVKGIECRYDRPRAAAVASLSRRESSDPTSTGVPNSLSARVNLPAGRGEMQVSEEFQLDNTFEPSCIDPQIGDELMQLILFNDSRDSHGLFNYNEIGSVSECLATVPFHHGFSPSSFFQGIGDEIDSQSLLINDNHSPIHSIQNMNYQIPTRIYNHVDCLTRLPIPDPMARYSARLIIQALRAYPLMMLRRETFPPFIHPHWHNQSTPALPICLANCMSVAQLFASRTTETEAFLWQTVKSETQRFRDEIKNFSIEELLAAIQAQLIYIIMRFVDEATQPADLNVHMLMTYSVLCERFREIEYESYPDRLLNPCTQVYPCTNWESWILAESSLRTCLVFLLISRIASLYTGLVCSTIENYQDLPLCSPKTIWEAKTRATWTLEYTTYTTHTQSVELFTVGQLIEARGMSSDRMKYQALDSWNARVDSLGNLLNISMGLIHV